MSQAAAPLMLLSVAIWPLLLATLVAVRPLRPLALSCARWAALPALVTAAALPDTELRLPGVLLGSALCLDGTGRAFLLLNAILFLTAGLLACPLRRCGGASRFAVLLLLAMAGGFALVLAADALLFFAAGTLAAYSLYGLLVREADGSALTAGRVLLVSLVASDLLLFELLAMLAPAAGSVDFASLRLAWAVTGDSGLMLGLLIASLGIKTGVVGAHFWLATGFASAPPAVRPALIGAMLGTGLLGWLRLMPLGDVHWSGAGELLQWLAWITPGYALGAGLLQARSRSVLAYAGMALNGLWLAMLGAVLSHPQAWNGMAQGVRATVLQSGLALATLLVLDRRMSRNIPTRLRHLPSGLVWIAALLLVTAPMGIRGSMAGADGMAALQVSWVTVCLAFLVVRALLPITPAIDCSGAANTVLPSHMPRVTTLPVAGVPAATALLAAVYNLVGLSATELWLIVLTVPIASLAAWLSVERLVPLLPALPPGDLLVPMSKGLAATRGRVHSLADAYLPLWLDTGRALLRRLRSGADWRRIVGRFESDLNRWPAVLVALLLLGVMVAWLGAHQ